MSNRSMYSPNEYFLKDVFIVDAITAECRISKGFCELHWRHTRRLCKAEDLYIHFGDNIVHAIRFQETIDHFTIIGQCSSFLRVFYFDDKAMR